MTTVTKTYHTTTYPAISPTDPNNSVAGRNVLIVGGTVGIGFEVATSFVKGHASNVVICSRRPDMVEKAVASLESARADSSKQKVTGIVADMASEESMNQMWAKLKADGIVVDVLVINAFKHSPLRLSEAKAEATAEVVDFVVLGGLRVIRKFLDQGPEENKVIISMSSASAHILGQSWVGPYAASKAAFAVLLQHLADEQDPKKTTIFSLHPGAIITEATMKGGMDKDTFNWEDIHLPADFCVWLTNPRARFLHGRFLWAHWDVDELLARKEEFEKDAGFLKIGLVGAGNDYMSWWFKKKDSSPFEAFDPQNAKETIV